MSFPRMHALAVVAALAASHCGGSKPTPPRDASREVTEAPLRAARVVAGRAHACALLPDGTVACWGDNQVGQLGDATREPRNRPVLVRGVDGAEAIAAGADHTCALRKGGGVFCWGSNDHGQLGDGGTQDRPTPVQVPELEPIASIAAGGRRTCVLKSDGFALCFGELEEGGTVSSPTPVFGMSQAEAIAVGDFHACARVPTTEPAGAAAARAAGTSAPGNVRCWGQNGMRQLGVTRAADRGLPVEVPELRATALSLGREHSCARTEDGLAVCWGAGLRCVPGEWFEGKRAAVKPGGVPGLENVGAVAAGGDQACAILGDGSVSCVRARAWRWSGAAAPRKSFILRRRGGRARRLGCATRDGAVHCWGTNSGQLGTARASSRLRERESALDAPHRRTPPSKRPSSSRRESNDGLMGFAGSTHPAHRSPSPRPRRVRGWSQPPRSGTIAGPAGAFGR